MRSNTIATLLRRIHATRRARFLVLLRRETTRKSLHDNKLFKRLVRIGIRTYKVPVQNLAVLLGGKRTRFVEKWMDGDPLHAPPDYTRQTVIDILADLLESMIWSEKRGEAVIILEFPIRTANENW